MPHPHYHVLLPPNRLGASFSPSYRVASSSRARSSCSSCLAASHSSLEGVCDHRMGKSQIVVPIVGSGLGVAERRARESPDRHQTVDTGTWRSGAVARLCCGSCRPRAGGAYGSLNRSGRWGHLAPWRLSRSRIGNDNAGPRTISGASRRPHPGPGSSRLALCRRHSTCRPLPALRHVVAVCTSSSCEQSHRRGFTIAVAHRHRVPRRPRG